MIKHIVKEGSKDHVLSWDSNGTHCSEPNCEINSVKQLYMKEKDGKRIWKEIR